MRDEDSNFYKVTESQYGNAIKTTALPVLHFVKFDEEGNVLFTQGFNNMPGKIFKVAIKDYFSRFDPHSKTLMTDCLI